jgi:predicted ester cyclase
MFNGATIFRRMGAGTPSLAVKFYASIRPACSRVPGRVEKQETKSFVLPGSLLFDAEREEMPSLLFNQREEETMSIEQENKATVGRWFTRFWGKTCDLTIVDEIAAPDMLLHYSLHEPRRGRKDIKAFMTDFREAFPDLNFRGVADLIAEGDWVVGRWEGGGTHTGPAFSDFLMGSLPAATGRKMRFTGTTVLRLEDGKIVEEIGLDDGSRHCNNWASFAWRRNTFPLGSPTMSGPYSSAQDRTWFGVRAAKSECEALFKPPRP